MRLRRLLSRWGDPALGGLLATAMTGELLSWADRDLPVSVALVLLATLPLAVRRTSPLASLALVQFGIHALTIRQPGFDNDSATFVVAFILSLYSLGRHARGRERWWGGVGLLAVMLLVAQGEGDLNQVDLGDVAFLLGFVGAPWAAGLTIQLRREREAELRAEAEKLRREQEEREHRAVAAERARIARELHDVVSHAISVTVLQARGARRVLDLEPGQVRRALDAIEQTNTAALSDMRRLLAVLRDTERDTGVVDLGGHAGPAETPAHEPQPTLGHLDSLIAGVRAAGLQVDLEVDGDGQAVPPGVDLSAYRIVQEALTNVLKHSAGGRATIRLRYAPDELEVTVADDGPAGAADGAGPGQGLIGIRERVGVIGGTVSARALPSGGFEVRARLPYFVEVP